LGLSAILLKDEDSSQIYEGKWALLVFRPGCRFSQPVVEKWDSITTNADLAPDVKVAEISTESTQLLSILEVKSLPSIKYIEQGKVFTYEGVVDEDKLSSFLKNPIKQSRVYNYLPESYSIWAKYQYDAFFKMIEFEVTLI
jgi:hypothetical protein